MPWRAIHVLVQAGTLQRLFERRADLLHAGLTHGIARD
jgi:hypothetical protein